MEKENSKVMLVNRATGLRREPIPRPVRKGKTHKDAANGNKQRNYQRKQERASWQQNSQARAETFPV